MNDEIRPADRVGYDVEGKEAVDHVPISRVFTRLRAGAVSGGR